jgi:hypothetical protein
MVHSAYFSANFSKNLPIATAVIRHIEKPFSPQIAAAMVIAWINIGKAHSPLTLAL